MNWRTGGEGHTSIGDLKSNREFDHSNIQWDVQNSRDPTKSACVISERVPRKGRTRRTIRILEEIEGFEERVKGGQPLHYLDAYGVKSWRYIR